MDGYRTADEAVDSCQNRAIRAGESCSILPALAVVERLPMRRRLALAGWADDVGHSRRVSRAAPSQRSTIQVAAF
jgi:hypothetical protein